jgi:glucose dehydrogenase
MARSLVRTGLVSVSFVIVVGLIAAGPRSMTGRLAGQTGSTGQPNPERRVAPLQRRSQGHPYSPLDQITGSNFNKLEVAWRFKTDNFGPFPEFKLEGTPLMVKGVLYSTAGTRRSVIALDAKTGELIWSHSLREGKRAAVAPRQLSGRGVEYWTDGRGDERVLYVTTGYRLVSLNAKTGALVSSFGTNGVVDLKQGVVYGNRQPIDLKRGDWRPLDADRRQDTVIIGSSFREGATVPDTQQHQGRRPRVRREDRQAAVDVQYHSASR